jgi:hypothetical protein
MQRAFAKALLTILWGMTASAGDAPQSLFQRRILPILKSPNASSCADCHLNGVDLKQYIGKDAASTFAALRDQGLVDVDHPDDSKLLQLIARAPEGPSLIGADVRKQEYEAFREWITAAINDPDLKKAPGANAKLGPDLPDDVIRHTRTDHVLERFVDLVWAEVERCAACHSPLQNQKQVEEHGEQISWIVPKDPAATLERIREHKLVDLDAPEKSLLLLKPTNQVEHGGGIKMRVGDRTYRRFRSFIEDYAKSRKGEYATAAQLPELPEDVTLTTDIWLRITDLPEFAIGKTLCVEIVGAGDDSELKAAADRYVFPPGNSWQQHLSLVAERNSARAKQLQDPDRKIPKLLAPGKYRLKVYVDRTDRLIREYPTQPGPEEFVREFEIEAKWQPGYGQMTVVAFPAK